MLNEDRGGYPVVPAKPQVQHCVFSCLKVLFYIMAAPPLLGLGFSEVISTCRHCRQKWM